VDQQRLELRTLYLTELVKGFELKRAKLSDVSEIRRLDDEILSLQGGIIELKQWAREIDQDPGYGKLIRHADGIRRPKLPVFVDKQQRAAALDNRAGTLTGLSESDVRRAREFRAKEDAEISIKNMDGRSPYIPEEERGPPRGCL
jgi:hypothetical protein